MSIFKNELIIIIKMSFVRIYIIKLFCMFVCIFSIVMINFTSRNIKTNLYTLDKKVLSILSIWLH